MLAAKSGAWPPPEREPSRGNGSPANVFTYRTAPELSVLVAVPSDKWHVLKYKHEVLRYKLCRIQGATENTLMESHCM